MYDVTQRWNAIFGITKNICGTHFMYGVAFVWIPACIWEIFPIPKTSTFFFCSALARVSSTLIVNILCVRWIPHNCPLRSWERLLFRPLSYISTLEKRSQYIEDYIVAQGNAEDISWHKICNEFVSGPPWPLTHFSLLPIKSRAKLLVKCLSIRSICMYMAPY